MDEPVATWSSRFALFAGALVVLALVLHRLGRIETPTFVNVVGLGFALAALAVALGLYAGGSIWIRGRSGAWQVFTGVGVGLLVWSWPIAAMPRYFSLPRINDLSTDTANAPRFVAMAGERKFKGNGVVYPGAESARLQAQAYPDIRTLVVERSVEETHDIVYDLIAGRRGFGWRIAADQPPQLKPAKAGFIEATERSLIIGFVDDIAIRIEGNEQTSRIDVRSASRFGQHDFGANAARIRRFMREITARLEAMTLPGAVRRPVPRPGQPGAVPAGKEPVAKRPIERLREKAATARAQDPAPKDARRGPAPKAPRPE